MFKKIPRQIGFQTDVTVMIPYYPFFPHLNIGISDYHNDETTYEER